MIEIHNGVARMPEFRLAEPVSVAIPADGPLAIVGLNAAGKSKLVDMLTGAHPLCGDEVRYDFSPSPHSRASQNIRTVTFHDAYGGAFGDFYQLRWNHGLQEDSATVGEILGRGAAGQGIVEALGIENLLPKQLIMLSSGELRKVQLAEVLLSRPRLLIIDNPYIGLDAEARGQITGFLQSVAREGKTKIVVVVSRAKDVPGFITDVLPVEGGRVLPITGKEQYFGSLRCKAGGDSRRGIDEATRRKILSLPEGAGRDGDPVVECRNISIGYGGGMILRDFSWTVRSGERWALGGRNGSGKSTLLSLVCADNPQAYACDISLFGKARGSGESIWDIKRRIGYVSPEMFRAYRRSMPVVQIMASGLSDSQGIFGPARLTPEAEDKAMFWLGVFGIAGLAERNYMRLSSGEQRLVLLARAFVKDPELLVLDEPFHGLDDGRREWARGVIDAFCSRRGKTLIMVTHYADEFPQCVDHRLTLGKQQQQQET